jgi:glycogen(starch) synthase
MKLEKLDTTVVMFFITHRPFRSINAQVLQSQAIKGNLAQEVKNIQKELGEKLFLDLATGSKGELPNLQDYVSDERRLALKRIIKVWKSYGGLPLICTHILQDDQHDEILNYLRYHNLINLAEDRVKVVYHPDFITPQSPLGVQDYQSFVRGCHLSLFPSYYEPWGYTPLESMACGVATAASDLSGFGKYVQSNFPGSEKKGLFVVKRELSFEEQVEQLAEYLFEYVKFSRRERMKRRNRLENMAQNFDWDVLYRYYEDAYRF